MRVIWSPLAEIRAGEALEAMLRERPAAGAAWLERLLAGVAQLGRFPERGRMVPEFMDKNIREIFVYSYRLIYGVDVDRVSILALIHGRRDFQTAWHERDRETG